MTPHGKLRFALTCRYVRPELMANDEERRFAEVNGKLPDGHDQYTYNGDVESQFTEVDQNCENIANVERSMNDLAARAIAGELDRTTIRRCCDFLSQLIAGMDIPERQFGSPGPELGDGIEDA